MQNQIIEITNQYPILASFNKRNGKGELSENMSTTFWMHMYPPLSYDHQLPKLNARQLCPWTMAAELADTATSIDRKQNIFRALNNGLKAIKQFDLPAYRIIFAEENITRKITIWLD